jgi:TatD DNase family protein
MKIIDAHSHIDYITHNFQQDVVGTICSGTNESQWNDLIKIINDDNCVYGAFGVHPWFVESVVDGFDERLSDLLKTNRYYMVGEIGLDKYHSNMDKQIDVFIKQLNIAVKLHRPMFLHCVGAWDKIFHILKQYKKSDLPIIIAHDFHGNDKIIDNLLDNYNVMFSFNKIDKDQDSYRIERIPIENILVESDGKSDVKLKGIVDKIKNIKQNKNSDNIIYNNTCRILKYV